LREVIREVGKVDGKEPCAGGVYDAVEEYFDYKQ
jgi:hypothetical protein